MIEQRVMHKSYLDHPLVGAARRVKPRVRSKQTCSHFEAWTWLNMEPWTWQIVPGEGANYITLDVGVGVEHLPDVAIEWNWPAAVARQFVVALAEEKLITEGLAFLMLERIRVARNLEQRRNALSRKTRAAVLAKTSGLCVYCGVKLTVVSGQPHSFQPDHVLPVKLGGSDDIANLIPSCAACNAKKSAKTLVVFAGVPE